MTHPVQSVEMRDLGGAADLVQPLLALSKATRQLVSLKLAEIGVVAGQDQLLDAIDRHDRRGICDIARDLSVRPFPRCWIVWSGVAGAAARMAMSIFAAPSFS